MKNLKMSYTKSAKSPSQPFSNVKYHPKTEISELCTKKEHHFYQQIIGITRWMTDLGRIDMSTKLSLMSRYISQPRIGHLIQVLHMLSYLKINQCMELTYDPTSINVK